MKINDLQLKDFVSKCKIWIEKIQSNKINTDINLNDLKGLDIKKIGTWPIWIKSFIWFVIFVTGYNFMDGIFVEPEVLKISNQIKLIEEGKVNYIKNHNLVENLQEFRKQLSNFKPKVDELNAIVPVVSKMPIVISFITSEADKYNLTVDTIRPGSVNDAADVGYQALTVKVIGDYFNFADFLLSISSSKRLLTIHALSIELGTVAGSKDLVFDFEIRAYWQSKGVLNA